MNSSPVVPILLGLLIAVIAIVGTLICVLLTMLLNRVTALDTKVDKKLDKEDCDKAREECPSKNACAGFWTEFNKHSHTGLPPDSKVTR